MTASVARPLALHRHQLGWLSDAGWARQLAVPRDTVGTTIVQHWARHRLPLVVTQQAHRDLAGPDIAMGLPAPRQWESRRMPLVIDSRTVQAWSEFPEARALVDTWPQALQADAVMLCEALERLGAPVRVHGSHGWQALTGCVYVRAGSDIDLTVAVATLAQADAAAQALAAFPAHQPRLDGELVFPDGRAVAWREWLAWRGGSVRSVLVRRLDGHDLIDGHPCPDTGRPVLEGLHP
jgi:phosphoribosyl-dephospho-CoA transferase